MMFSLSAINALLLAHVAVAQISRTGWTVTVDSFETTNPATYAIDGNSSTFWHTEYSPTTIPLPHNITIDMQTDHFVNSISYLPRQDGTLNGNIGQHQVYLSTDGVNFGSPVSIGTFLDDDSLKTTSFTPVSARYLRIYAITEAGNRGPWSSATEINAFEVASLPAAPISLGKWGPTIIFPIVPVAVALLYNTGDLLAWSSYAPDTFTGGADDMTITSTYSPSTGTVTEAIITNTGHDMFCPGLSIDTTGRPFVTGGNSDDKTSIYSVSANAWSSGPGLKIPRGYQATATLSDGRTFCIGGSWNGGEGGKNGEIYSPTANTWTLLPGCPVAPMLTDDAQGVFRQDNHGWLFGWKNGSTFQAGPSKAMNWYGTSGTGSTTPAGLRGADTDAMNGNAVMYDAINGKILAVGGAVDYQDANATSNAHIITIGAPSTTASTTTLTNMHFARSFAESVVLPDGKVFITGGQTYAVPFSDDTSILTPELWDPSTQEFTVLNPHSIPRNYHSVALLLMDGTVFNGGGGLCDFACTTNHNDGEIYSPAYLFNADGTLATRPVIQSATASVAVGGKITAVMAAGSGAVEFALIRIGSNTHTVNTDQRRIALTATASGSTYTMSVSDDPGIALPGYWMLFALSTAGVPSIAATVLITA